MSVLIKNTTMPKNCIECPMQFGGWCYVCPPDIDERVAETVEEAVKQGKPDWCPLVEIEGDDIAPVVHGRWVITHDFDDNKAAMVPLGRVVRCSICGYPENRAESKYCPDCGAKMDESEESKNV